MVTSAKDEGPYLIEWISYYKTLGVDDIFIYSNDNKDGSDTLSSSLAEAGEIYYIDNKQLSGSAQGKCFNHAVIFNDAILNYEYSIVVDTDEFIWINHDIFANINEFLEFQERNEVDSIGINWVPVSSFPHISYSSSSVLERFTFTAGEPMHQVKSIFKPHKAGTMHAHFAYPAYKTRYVRRMSNGDPFVCTYDRSCTYRDGFPISLTLA